MVKKRKRPCKLTTGNMMTCLGLGVMIGTIFKLSGQSFTYSGSQAKIQRVHVPRWHKFCKDGRDLDLCLYNPSGQDLCLELSSLKAETAQDCKNWEKAFRVYAQPDFKFNFTRVQVVGQEIGGDGNQKGISGLHGSFVIVTPWSSSQRMHDAVHRAYKDSTQHAFRKLKDVEVFFDIGGGLGLFSIAAAKVHKSLNVVAVEPQPLNFLLLHHNIAANGLLGRVRAANRALYAEEIDVRCLYDRESPEMSRAVRDLPAVVPPSGHVFRVQFKAPALTLENIVENYGQRSRKLGIRFDCLGCESDVHAALTRSQSTFNVLFGDVVVASPPPDSVMPKKQDIDSIHASESATETPTKQDIDAIHASENAPETPKKQDIDSIHVKEGATEMQKQQGMDSKHASENTLEPPMTQLSEEPLRNFRPQTKMSKVKCTEPALNRSCVFTNLYFIDSSYVVLVLQGTHVPDMTISLSSKHGTLMSPQVQRFSTTQDLDAYVANARVTREWKGLTILFNVMWHHNIGHALFDGLYPGYLAACRFGLHAVPFRSVAGIDRNPTRYMSEDIMEKFSGKGLKRMFELYGQNTLMEVAVMGSRNMGQRHMNADVALHGGREFFATRRYRDRLYITYAVKPESEDRQAVIIHNRRFTDADQAMLRGIKDIDGMHVEFLDWGTIKGFASQLRKLRKVAVHVSSIGTGQMYKPFLKDGSVDVALGALEATRQSPFPLFMEQYIAEGSPHIRTLYYDSTKRICGLQKNETRSLIGRAIRLFRDGFSLPVLPGENLSPEGKVFRKLCQESDCKDLLMSMNPDMANTMHYPGICLHDAWVEFVVYEQGGWHPEGHEGQHCPVKRKKLQEIKKDAQGLAPQFPSGAQIMCTDGVPRAGNPCEKKNGKLPGGRMPLGTKLLTVADIRNRECFELMAHENSMRLAVRGENRPFPESIGIVGGPDETEKVISNFRMVPALTHRKDAISLESCKHPGLYLRHNQHNLVVEPPVAPPDAVWLLPHNVANDHDCVNFRAAVSTDLVITIRPGQIGAVAASGGSTCMRMRAPGRAKDEDTYQGTIKAGGIAESTKKDNPKNDVSNKESSKKENLEHGKQKEPSKKQPVDCSVDGMSPAVRVATMADGKPCKTPTRTCERTLADASVGEHGVCHTPDLQQDFKNKSCLVYGIGVADDWEFEKAMARKGCEVHAFDPTIDHPPPKEKSLTNLRFHKWGLAGKTATGQSKVAGTLSGATTTSNPMFTLPDMMDKLGHAGRRLSVLKVDCEGCEWEALSAVPESLWTRIDQMSLELHFSDGLMLDSASRLKKAAKVATALRAAGFVQWRTSSREGWPWHRKFLPELKEAGMPPGLCCRLIGYMRWSVPWGNARNECFEISQKKSNRFLTTQDEDKPWPASAVEVKQRNPNKVSVFHVVPSITGGARQFSLESCRHGDHFLRHNSLKLVIEPPVSVQDATWWIPEGVNNMSTCIKLKPLDTKYTLRISEADAQLTEDDGSCVEFRKSSLGLAPPKTGENLPTQEQCEAGDVSDAARVSAMADHKPCKLIPIETCQNQMPEASVGEHGLCMTAGLANAFSAENCLVYGIGIADNWDFEKAMARRGCEVHAFDPTIDRPPSNEPGLPNLHFHRWGLAGESKENGEFEVRGTLSGATKTSQPMLTLPDMMQKLQHAGRTLTVLKIDCEGCEWASLAVVPDELWKKIDQISFEVHYSDGLMLDSPEQLKNAAKVARAIEKNGFVQWRTDAREGWPHHRMFLKELRDAGMRPGLCCRLIGYMQKQS